MSDHPAQLWTCPCGCRGTGFCHARLRGGCSTAHLPSHPPGAWTLLPSHVGAGCSPVAGLSPTFFRQQTNTLTSATSRTRSSCSPATRTLFSNSNMITGLRPPHHLPALSFFRRTTNPSARSPALLELLLPICYRQNVWEEIGAAPCRSLTATGGSLRMPSFRGRDVLVPTSSGTFGRDSTCLHHMP